MRVAQPGYDTRRRADPMPGTLNPAQVRFGVPRGPFGLRQRRVSPRVFGEPEFECELVPETTHPARPHILAYAAWQQLSQAGARAGLDSAQLAIHSAYRPVSLQHQIWTYRLAERQRLQPELTPTQAARIQQKWTAKPGRSAHHTGLALDLGLYHLGKSASKRTPEYRWLAQNAAQFGFYPYLPEAWHWEYNPPGLVEQIAALRQALASGAAFAHLLELPKEIPTAKPAN